MHRIVEKIMGGDEAMASFLQRLLGYGITGEVREEIFPIWTGSGRNGKGLLTQALQQLLGAYYKEMNCAIISDSRVCSNIDAERAKLIGARLAVFNELKDGEKLKTNEVQLLTGGDGFPAKALYKDPVTVQPRHLAILVTNYMPEMPDAIVAMVERLMVVEFPVTFRDLIPGENETVTLRQSDKTMKERLKSPEGQSALFAWLVEGAVAWYSGTESLKAGAPKKVTEFTRQYLADQDDDAMRIPGIIKDNWDKGDYGLGQIAHFLLQGSVKKTGKGCSDYFIFEEDTCRWVKVDEGRVKSVVVEAMEEALRDVNLWIATQSAQRRLQGGDAKMRVANLDLKKREVVSLIRYIRSNRGVTNVMVFAGPLLMDETFEQRLDSNRHLIGIKGGSVVDLRTGQKRQRVAEDMVHNELDVVYDNNNDNHATTTMMTNAARAEWMHRIIHKIMGGDEAMAKFLQRLLGYGITGEVREGIFPYMDREREERKGAIDAGAATAAKGILQGDELCDHKRLESLQQHRRREGQADRC
eukprot:gene24919-biopygen19344